METTGCAILGLVFLVLTNVTSIISFATPYWIQTHHISRGLWAECTEITSCVWLFEEWLSHMSEPDEEWWLATRDLMFCGQGVCLFALVLAIINMNCDCASCINANRAVAVLLFMEFLAGGAAVIVFGVHADDKFLENFQKVLTNPKENMDVNPDTSTFSWSFWLAAVTSGLSLITAIIYEYEARQKNS